MITETEMEASCVSLWNRRHRNWLYPAKAARFFESNDEAVELLENETVIEKERKGSIKKKLTKMSGSLIW